MNAGAVRNSSYYLKSYGEVVEAPPPEEEMGSWAALQAEIDGDTGWAGEGLDSFETEPEVAATRFSAPVLIEELRRQEGALAVQIEGHPEAEAALRTLETLRFLVKRLIPLGESGEIPQYMVDEYLLLQAGIGKIQTGLETSAQLAGPLDRLARLSSGLEAALGGPDLEPARRHEMEALLPRLGKAKGVLELAADPEAAVLAAESVEDLLIAGEELLAGFEEDREAFREELDQALEDFRVALGESTARNYYRLKVAKRLAALQAQFEEGSVPLRDIAQGLEELRGQLKDAVEKTAEEKKEGEAEEARKDAYRGLAGKIPLKLVGSDYAQDLAERIGKAVDTGKWGPVEAYLTWITEHDDVTHTQGDFAVSLVVSALYFGPAGESEEKLKELLDVLPKKVRERMIEVVELNSSDWRGLGLDTASARREVGLYGTTDDTIALLKDSLK